MDGAGKKTAAAIHQEVAREVNQLLGRIFAQRHHRGQTNLEAVESALRAALHLAGASALSALLQYQAPAPEQRRLPCACGRQAQYQGLRSKSVLTVLGVAPITRPYYLCAHCHHAQIPADVEWNVSDTGISPGVRRMPWRWWARRLPSIMAASRWKYW